MSEVFGEHAKPLAPHFGRDPLSDDQYDDENGEPGDCVEALESRRAYRCEVDEISVAQARGPRELRRDRKL